MHSHHSHSGQFCAHAKDDLLDVLEHAYQLGFTHFNVTEHCPRALEEHLYPEEREAGLKPADLEKRFVQYLAHARSLQEVFKTRSMHVLVGCESENLNSPQDSNQDSLAYLQDQLERLSIRRGKQKEQDAAEIGLNVVDYIVGSTHHVRGIPIDFDIPTFESALKLFEDEENDAREAGHQAEDSSSSAHARLTLEYLDRQYELMQRLRPEVIGHFDLFRLYRPSFRIRSTEANTTAKDDLTAQIWSRIERNVRYACAYGALFEANSASFRKGWETAYPGAEILALILQLKGRVCLSDDSHGKAYVALNYRRLREYLLNAGVQELWYLERAAGNQVLLPNEVAQSSEEEVQRRAKEAKDFSDAPTRFARGTVAKKLALEEWRDHVFWDKLES